ncbi:hypothetical protein [Clostridium sp. C2-6-12]|uniref:hypothetical protein n=1 Tax=Clostridium sp. C2-6-12 TaxID=2698832 RepID=UPI001FAD7BDE|nr:hypothetical protein [Clostridium sp. C2-6-12]
MGVIFLSSGINRESRGTAIRAKPKPVIPCTREASKIETNPSIKTPSFNIILENAF